MESGYSAEGLLQRRKEEGLFLVRLNLGGNIPTETAPFTISRVESHTIVHTRIILDVRTPRTFRYHDHKGVEQSYPYKNGIVDLMDHIMETNPDMLKKVCPRSVSLYI